MILLLTQITENGFALISDKGDPLAAVISKHNVGELVHKDKKTTVIGLPPDAWSEHKMCLVPTAQSI